MPPKRSLSTACVDLTDSDNENDDIISSGFEFLKKPSASSKEVVDAIPMIDDSIEIPTTSSQNENMPYITGVTKQHGKLSTTNQEISDLLKSYAYDDESSLPPCDIPVVEDETDSGVTHVSETPLELQGMSNIRINMSQQDVQTGWSKEDREHNYNGSLDSENSVELFTRVISKDFSNLDSSLAPSSSSNLEEDNTQELPASELLLALSGTSASAKMQHRQQYGNMIMDLFDSPAKTYKSCNIEDWESAKRHALSKFERHRRELCDTEQHIRSMKDKRRQIRDKIRRNAIVFQVLDEKLKQIRD